MVEVAAAVIAEVDTVAAANLTTMVVSLKTTTKAPAAVEVVSGKHNWTYMW